MLTRLIFLLAIFAAPASLADPLPEWVELHTTGPWPFRVLHVAGDGSVCGVVSVAGTAYPVCIQDRYMVLPGIGPQAECQYEREIADKALSTMRTLLSIPPVQVAELAPDDHRRGWTGRIEVHNRSDLSVTLFDMGLARHPQIPEQPWCGW